MSNWIIKSPLQTQAWGQASLPEFTALPIDPRSRAMWHYIAQGSCEDETWYIEMTMTMNLIK